MPLLWAVPVVAILAGCAFALLSVRRIDADVQRVRDLTRELRERIDPPTSE